MYTSAHSFAIILIGLLSSVIEGTFIHPGILHTHADLTRMKINVQLRIEPWKSNYDAMCADKASSLNYTMAGPNSVVTRDGKTGVNSGYNQLIRDSRATIQLALRYFIEGDQAYANKATSILDTWSSELKVLNGSDISLGASLPGMNLVNAAEILRYEHAGWAAASVERFEAMISDLFYKGSTTLPLVGEPYSGGFGTTPEKAIVAFGVFTNNRTMYNEGLDLYKSKAACGNLGFMISPDGQYVESGRDQGHTQLSLGNMAELSQIAFSQGDPSVWSLLDYRLNAGYEYTSKYLTGSDVPYNSSHVACGAEKLGWNAVSPLERNQTRPTHEIAYAHYVGIAHRPMPYTKQLIQEKGQETVNPVNAEADNAEWGTLRFRRTSKL